MDSVDGVARPRCPQPQQPHPSLRFLCPSLCSSRFLIPDPTMSCPQKPGAAHEVSSFKVPSAEDLDHDYVWRYVQRLPQRGRIGIFNRSYYEEVLVVRVHKEALARKKMPPALVTKSIWEERYEDIRNFERYLARNGYDICKFFLHFSGKEQKKQFLQRLEIL